MNAQKKEMHMDRKYLLSTVTSKDRFSKKYIFQTMKGDASFEASSFYRMELNRYDLCISTSAGCNLECKICECTYSSPKFERHLSSYEIIDQIIFLLKDGAKHIDQNTMILVVFMGNGDPLLNINSMIQAISATNNIYSNIVTRYGLSTIGVNIKSLSKLAILSDEAKIEIRIQFSTLNIDDSVRKFILPKSSLLSEVIEHLDRYGRETNSAIRYNFPMISGVNDSIEHFDKIVSFANQNPDYRIIKLSSYNETSFSKYTACSDDKIREAGHYLEKNNVRVELFFANRDKRIRGACGQLRKKQKITFNKIISISYSSSNCTIFYNDEAITHSPYHEANKYLNSYV